jgi:hypothetical protein
MPQKPFGSSPHFEMHDDGENRLQIIIRHREHDRLENLAMQLAPSAANGFSRSLMYWALIVGLVDVWALAPA